MWTFLNQTQFQHSNGPISSQSKEGGKVYAWHETKEKNCITREKQLKLKYTWIYEKVWLLVSKSKSAWWVLLKFMCETSAQPPPKLLCPSCWFQLTLLNGSVVTAWHFHSWQLESRDCKVDNQRHKWLCNRFLGRIRDWMLCETERK